MTRRAAAPLALALSACAGSSVEVSLARTEQLTRARLAVARAASSDPHATQALALTRDEAVALAIAQSPSLRALAHRARALVHGARAAGALPSGELGVEVWNLPLERPYALGEARMYMLEFRQRIPVLAALDARARGLSAQAGAALGELAAEERLVAQRAADAYTEHARAIAERSLQRAQLALLERVAAAARARYSTLSAALSELPRIDLETARVQRAIARLDGDAERSAAALNALLRRPAGAPISVPSALVAETARGTLDEDLARALTTRGSTRASEAGAQASRARREAADAEARVPEFMVSLGYWQDPQMRPGFGLGASMSLPWLWGPQRHRARQAREEELASRDGRERAALEVQSEVSQARARIAASERGLRVLRSQALPAARRALEAITAAYATGDARLIEWLDVARSALALESEELSLIAGLHREINELERSIGAPVARVALAPEASP